MSFYYKFALFQCAIILPFIAGCCLRPRLSGAEDISRKLLRLNIILLEPLIVLWCTWGLGLSPGLLILPFLGFGLVAAGVLAGSWAATMLNLQGQRRKTFLICCSLANHGFTLGGGLCYFLFGEQGLGYSVILVLYFIPYVFCLVFPYARTEAGQAIFTRGFFKELVLDVRNMPLFAMAAGLCLNMLGISRPAGIGFPVDELLLTSIALYYAALGLTFTGVDFAALRRELAMLSIIKFAVVPAAAFCVLALLPLDPAMKNVVQLQSFMPVAIYAVVVSVLFEHDTGLASGLFVCSTVLFLVAVLPVIFLLF